MAYEHMTYDAILDRILKRVTDKNPNLDTREGSMIYNAVAPEAMELAIAYTELDNIRNETFIYTATREGKINKCKEIGIDTNIFNATAGEFKAVFNIEVPMGSRWNLDLYNYTVTEYVGKAEDGNYEYHVICETVGTAPNGVFGTLTPILDTYSNLQYAELVEVLIEGENESSDAEIEQYYVNKVNGKASDANVFQYEVWCSEYSGIGNYKIFPLWNGKNTVKVSILSASNGVATDELIAEYQQYLDPNSRGMGDGKAPIGAYVTVSTANEKPIELAAKVSLNLGYDNADGINEAISKYFSDIAYDGKYLSYMRLGAIILDCPCVEFISELTVNGGTSDIIFGDEEIPVLGNTTWTVVTV